MVPMSQSEPLLVYVEPEISKSIRIFHKSDALLSITELETMK